MFPKKTGISTGSVYEKEREIPVSLKGATKCPVTALGLGINNQFFPALLVIGTEHGVRGWVVYHNFSVEWLLSIISQVRQRWFTKSSWKLVCTKEYWETYCHLDDLQPLLFLDLMLCWSLWDLGISMKFLYCFSQTTASQDPGTLSFLLEWLLALHKSLHSPSAPVPLITASALFKPSSSFPGC